MKTIKLSAADAKFLEDFLMRQRWLPSEKEAGARCVAALMLAEPQDA